MAAQRTHKVKLDEEELTMIKQHRAKKKRQIVTSTLFRAALLCTNYWLEWSEENGGVGLTYSTFTNEYEFNCDAYILMIGDGYGYGGEPIDRAQVYELVKKLLRQRDRLII